jgi:hypothetical protein
MSRRLENDVSTYFTSPKYKDLVDLFCNEPSEELLEIKCKSAIKKILDPREIFEVLIQGKLENPSQITRDQIEAVKEIIVKKLSDDTENIILQKH